MKTFLKTFAAVTAALSITVAYAAINWVVNNGDLTTAGTLYGGRPQAGEVSNCAINIAATTITISGDNGTALSATNKCQIGVRSNTNGEVDVVTFTANVTTTFGAASDTDGNLFGITDADWANAMPVFFGVIYDGTTPYFGFSRKPLIVSGAAATDLCQEGDTDCDGESDFFIMTTGLTLANWVNLPITQVAWLSATYATTGGAWTFAESAYTGFNQLYDTQRWTFPVAQNGAAAGTFILANGGTAPIFTTNNYVYEITKGGTVTIEAQLSGDGGTDGSGAVATLLALPYAFANGTIGSYYALTGRVGGATTITSNHPIISLMNENTSRMTINYLDASVTVQAVTLGMFSNGGRSIDLRFSYQGISN